MEAPCWTMTTADNLPPLRKVMWEEPSSRCLPPSFPLRQYEVERVAHSKGHRRFIAIVGLSLYYHFCPKIQCDLWHWPRWYFNIKMHKALVLGGNPCEWVHALCAACFRCMTALAVGYGIIPTLQMRELKLSKVPQRAGKSSRGVMDLSNDKNMALL